MALTEFKTDHRGVEYSVRTFLPIDSLPRGWAQCGSCGISWNDEKPTSVTPTPSARCPFEAEHDDDDDEEECEGHPSTSGPIGNVVYCDGSCLT